MVCPSILLPVTLGGFCGTPNFRLTEDWRPAVPFAYWAQERRARVARRPPSVGPVVGLSIHCNPNRTCCNVIQTLLQVNSNNSSWAAILGFLSSVYNRTLTLPEAAQNSSDQVP